MQHFLHPEGPFSTVTSDIHQMAGVEHSEYLWIKILNKDKYSNKLTFYSWRFETGADKLFKRSRDYNATICSVSQ
jgi:hypothetical protein